MVRKCQKVEMLLLLWCSERTRDQQLRTSMAICAQPGDKEGPKATALG